MVAAIFSARVMLRMAIPAWLATEASRRLSLVEYGPPTISAPARQRPVTGLRWNRESALRTQVAAAPIPFHAWLQGGVPADRYGLPVRQGHSRWSRASSPRQEDSRRTPAIVRCRPRGTHTSRSDAAHLESGRATAQPILRGC